MIKTVHPFDGLSDHMTVIADAGVKLKSQSVFHTDVLKAYLLQILLQTLNFLL